MALKLGGYRIDMDRILRSITAKQAKTVVIQMPEGLRRHAQTLVEKIETKTKATVMVCADPCYGACDLAGPRLQGLGIDLIVHVGHLEIPVLHSPIPTLYANALSMQDPSQVVIEALPRLVGTRIGLVTTAQHLDELMTIEDVLRDHDFTPVVGRGGKRIAALGQILGCDFSAGTDILDQVDCFLFVGSGMFHPVGLALATHKPVIAADPYSGEVRREEIETEKDSMLRQRHAAIALAQTASRFGIIIGLKAGQQRAAEAQRLRELLKEKGKSSMLLLMDQCSPLVLQGFSELECFVSTACPRIALDDSALYKKPVLTPVELEVVLGVRSWDDYVFDQITG